MPERRCIIFNPTARGDRAARFRKFLDHVPNCELLPTTGPGAARILAAQAVVSGFRTVVAAGGDGTVNEVLNGMGDVSNGFDACRLAVIPLGTVNVLARELGISRKPEQAWRIVEQGRSRPFDLPEITCASTLGNERRYFLQMAGAGLDARAIELVSWELKKKLGPLAYVWAGMKALSRPQPTIRIQNDVIDKEGQFVIVSNGRLYGGDFVMTPGADYSDGRLDLCLFEKVNWWRLPFIATSLLTRRVTQSHMMFHAQAAEVHLTSADRCPVQVDGEWIGELPAIVRIHPGRLRLVVP